MPYPPDESFRNNILLHIKERKSLSNYDDPDKVNKHNGHSMDKPFQLHSREGNISTDSFDNTENQ